MYELLGHGFKLKQPPLYYPNPPLVAKGYKMGQASILMVSHHGLAIYYIKKYLKAKEELWKFKYGNSPCKNLIFKQTNPSKRNQNPSRYCNSRTNFKFQHKAKYHL
jgi:hypothetical protein